MATEQRSGTFAPILLAAAPLTWPALWNGYPLVFSDTGTYLSQAVEHYVGWDRPPFYSLFLLPLHMTLTTWPIVAVQALLTAHTLHLARRAVCPGSSAWWLLPLTIVLAIATALPWFVAEIMPDLFTGLLVLALGLLVFAADLLSTRERVWLVAFSAFMIAAHQSHVPLAFVLLIVLLPLRRWLGHGASRSLADPIWTAAPLLLGVIALMTVSIAAFGRVSLSPFGNVFLLAHMIYDGPGADVLRRDCPVAGWRLCAFVDQLPPTSDDFLWRPDGPVARAGGAKLVSAEAGEIIHEVMRTEPGTELRAALGGSMRQLGLFATGDGLQPWPATVTPWIEREFPPFENAAYANARQSRGILSVAPWLNALHATIALGSVAALPVLLRRRGVAGGLAVATLLAILANAAITGGLSMPHDRYQSRVMWLPATVVLLAAPRFIVR